MTRDPHELPFRVVVADPHPDDDAQAMAHLVAELHAIMATANRVALAARDNVRRDRARR